MTGHIVMAFVVLAAALVAVQSLDGKVCEKGWTRFSWIKCAKVIPCKNGDKCAPKDTKEVCTERSANAARIHNADENHGIQMLAAKNKGSKYYMFIDGSDKQAEKKWVDGSGVTLAYTPWANGEPNNYEDDEDCIGVRSGGMSEGGMWNDISCSHPREDSAHVCQKQPVTMGGWSGWKAWTGCSATCGYSGTRARKRSCDDPEPGPKGLNCVGASTETESCNIKICPVNGWSGWEAWGECTAKCGGGGQRTRTRGCDKLPPTSGVKCVGASSETESCNNHQCPVPTVPCGDDWARISPKKCVKLVTCKDNKCDSNDNQEVCGKLGAVVARVDNAEENTAIAALGGRSVEYLYIDGNDRDTEGTWVDMHKAKLTYTNWAAKEPNNHLGDENCLAMRTNHVIYHGQWNDLPCRKIGGAVHVCQQIPDGGDTKA